NLEKTRQKNGPIYLISLGQACTKMKLYQAKLWRLTGIPLAEYLRKLILLLSQFKEQARTERIFPRKVSKFNRQRYWMHYKYTL
ncbi:MAG: hypothetical protein KDI27_13540, partial [Gammaproteobacteria bacterium]|nr:hypothetical protein [Gammaproteobacteria bacterium]